MPLARASTDLCGASAKLARHARLATSARFRMIAPRQIGVHACKAGHIKYEMTFSPWPQPYQ